MEQNSLLEQVTNGDLLNAVLLSAIVNNQSPSASKSFDVISSFGFKETRGNHRKHNASSQVKI